MSKKLLFFNSSSYEDIKKKGVEDTYKIYLENGYFEKVLFICPFAKFTNDIYLENKSVNIFQSGWLPKIFLKTNSLFFKCFLFIFFFPKNIFNIYKKVKLFRPDIIRSSDPYLLGLFGILIAKIFKKPFTISVHADYDLGETLKGHTFKIFGSRKLAKKLESFNFKIAKRIFPIREYLSNKIKNEYPHFSNKIRVFPHAFDFNKMQHQTFDSIRNEYNVPKEKKILSFVGRLAPENFIFDLCKLSEILNKKNFRDYVILIFGDGELKAELQNLINQKKLDQYFMFAGYQPREKVMQLRKESFFSICFMGGMSLIETLASCTPAVCYNIEWHSELIIDKKTGIIADINDIEYIANSLIYYSKNNNELSKLRINAYEHVYKNYNLEKISKLKAEHYSEVINEYKHVIHETI
jgi:glycosyltransferase involved in cell wall biosynthesis